ncbi:hypothetical protein AAFF_G00214230 [Aldrovandia affinis]|uniref:Uncharacterized protein n=1 Tax=Aldrovandia affinis TaxID=143900 RepID=A0AAD7RGR0_9TELE|nr:hypothetical protein AAFF_G00214230 [Aldrovandia affinis]
MNPLHPARQPRDRSLLPSPARSLRHSTAAGASLCVQADETRWATPAAHARTLNPFARARSVCAAHTEDRCFSPIDPAFKLIDAISRGDGVFSIPPWRSRAKAAGAFYVIGARTPASRRRT